MTIVETDSVTAFVLGVIKDMLNMPLPESPSPQTPLGPGGLELESLALVELTVYVERQYSISFSDDLVDGLGGATLGELVAEIVSRCGRPAPAGEVSLSILDVKRLLTLSQVIADREPQDIADDAEVVLDSLTLVWVVYQLKEQYGIELEIENGEIAQLTSVAAIHEYLDRRLRGPGVPVGAVRADQR